MIRIKEKSKAVMANLFRKGGIEKTTVGLDVGKMICKPKKLLKGEMFLVKTPTAVAGVRGTNFSIEADKKKTTRVKVYDGKVAVVKRVKMLDEHVEKLIEAAPPVEKEEKVVITEKEVKEVEKKIEKVIKEEGKSLEEIAKQPEKLEKVVKMAQKEAVVKKEEIKKFKPEDFIEEKQEMIKVEEKPVQVVQKIQKAIKKSKAKPKPEGELLITKYEVYYIKDGRVQWEGELKSTYKDDDKLYVVSNEYVFCVSNKGPVLWRKKIMNADKLEIKKEKVMVYKGNTTIVLDKETGEKL